MKRYSKEFKNSIITRMLHPTNTPVPQLAIETRVPRDTLYCWRIAALRNGAAVDNNKTGRSKPLNGEEKLAVVMKTATLNKHELGAYCRKKGFYPADVKAWRDNCAQANCTYRPQADRKKAREQAKLIKELHSDNGSPMKGATMLATLQKLGVTPSCSRPSVSNDNPYSESLFKTMNTIRAIPISHLTILKIPGNGWLDLCIGTTMSIAIAPLTSLHPASGIGVRSRPFWRPGTNSINR